MTCSVCDREHEAYCDFRGCDAPLCTHHRHSVGYNGTQRVDFCPTHFETRPSCSSCTKRAVFFCGKCDTPLCVDHRVVTGFLHLDRSSGHSKTLHLMYCSEHIPKPKPVRKVKEKPESQSPYYFAAMLVILLILAGLLMGSGVLVALAFLLGSH